MAVSSDPWVALRSIRMPSSQIDTGEQMLMAAALGIGVATLLAVLLAMSRGRSKRAGPLHVFLHSLDKARSSPSADSLLAAQAGALRRYVGSTADPEKSSLQGDPWLRQLDEIFSTDFFSAGSGRIFGGGLYEPHVVIDPSELDSTLRRLAKGRRT